MTSLTKEKLSAIVVAGYKNLTNKIKTKGDSKMTISKKTSTNIKIGSLVAYIVAFGVGLSIVGLPSLNEQQVISLAYIALGTWLAVQFLTRSVR